MSRDKINRRVPALCVIGTLLSTFAGGVYADRGDGFTTMIFMALTMFFIVVALDW